MTLHAGMEPSPMVQKAVARFEFEMKFRKAFEPVEHWYQSDEEEPREAFDIMRDIVSDLQEDRKAALLLHRIVVELRKVDGDQAHRIMPHIWPLLCEASKMMPAAADIHSEEAD